MDEKYVITIDGPDCTGKSTLWLKANEYNKNIQIRGIVSNIAYAIKFKRNVDELLELYNQNQVNYVVYLLNPNNDNNFDNFKENIKDYNIQEIKAIIPNPAIKVLNVIPSEFEAEAKIESEFKYIVFINKTSKEEIMQNLYEGLDYEHKKMYDTLMEYDIDIYDCLKYYTPDELAEFLENYEFRCDVNVRLDIDTDTECYISLKDFCESNESSLEDYIYSDDNSMDDIYEAIKYDVNYNSDIDLTVERVR